MLDAAGRAEVLGRLGESRGARTVLHVTHRLDELLDADRVLVLNTGRLVADVSPGHLVSDAELLRENRLRLPTTLRLAAGLGLGAEKPRTPEELAAAVMRRVKPGVEAR
jgi:ABC-type multidrug transport system ATPase subunit